MGPKNKQPENHSMTIKEMLVPIALAVLGVMQGYQQNTQNTHTEELTKIIPEEAIDMKLEDQLKRRIAALEAKYMTVDQMHIHFITREDLDARFARRDNRNKNYADRTNVEIDRNERRISDDKTDRR